MKIWKDAMVQLLGQTHGEENEKESLIRLLLDRGESDSKFLFRYLLISFQNGTKRI